jgi:hypothetical protein
MRQFGGNKKFDKKSQSKSHSLRVEVGGIGGGRKRTTPPSTTMDYHNDEEWQAYYANMMIQNSPDDDASLSEHSASFSPENNHGGIGTIHSSNVSYETDDDDDDEEEKTPPPPAPKKKRPPKKKRDPNMPKGALTANLLYANANRARAKEEVSDIDTHFSIFRSILRT